MLQRKTVAIDIDDVLFPLVPHLTEFVNAREGIAVRPDDYYTYDFCRVWQLPRSRSVDLAEEFILVHSLAVEPIEGAKIAVEWAQSSVRLVIVTSREEHCRPKTEAWLQRHFGDAFDDLVMTGNHYRGRACESKGEACARLRVDYLIDDHPAHVASARRAGVDSLLFGEYPWQGSAGFRSSRRLRNWAQLHPMLSSMDATPLVMLP